MPKPKLAPPLKTQNKKPEPPLAPVEPAVKLPPPPINDRNRENIEPNFGHTSLTVAFRFIEPTWRNYIHYVDAEARSGNPDALRFVQAWQAISQRERASHVPEQICDIAAVKAEDLLSWVTRQAWVECAAKRSMVLSFLSDKVLESTAQYAIGSPDNYKHAELFLKASGIVAPAARGGSGGVTVPIYNMPVATSNSVALADSKSEAQAVSASGLRDMDQEIVELSRIMQMEDAPIKSAAEARATDPRDEIIDEGEDEEDADE